MKAVKTIKSKLGSVKNTAQGAWKAMAAGAAGAALLATRLTGALKEKASDVVGKAEHKKAKEGIYVKKSTFVAVLVALAAVAGVLGALYFYVLRREKELDEYEQLLFSEDFNDELPDDEDFSYTEE